jgi:YegS/Rv2252/BmrU family lipid kinase
VTTEQRIEVDRPSRWSDAPEPRASDRTLVIWNPTAGGGKGDGGDRRQVEAILARAALQFELFESRDEVTTGVRVDDAVNAGVGTIIAAGGDGTVRSVAFRLLGRQTALGILPMGTAMNVARSLDIPLDPVAAARVIAEGHVREIDVGEVRGQPFLEIASIGLGAEVLAEATEIGEGRLRGILDLALRAWRYQRTRVDIRLDGQQLRSRALSLAVANGRFTGRALELAPEATLDDGQFDVLLFEGFGGFELILHLARAIRGRPFDPRVRRYRASRVLIASHRPLPVRLDSQDLGSTPVELVTRRSALRVIAPEPTQLQARIEPA